MTPSPNSPSPRPLRRTRVRTLALALALVVPLVGVTACNVSWKLGKTHGAIIEPGARRASVGIYRVPTRVLRGVLGSHGIDVVQDILCSQGRFPAMALRTGSFEVSIDVIRAKWCGWVRGDDADLRGALIDAQAGSRDDCLALTLISQGAYIKNWTHKAVGCREGALG